MGLFDGLQDIIGGLTDNQVVQDLQEQATNVTEGATDAVSGVAEQGQSAIDDITQNFGL
jgi:hypothetical protein